MEYPLITDYRQLFLNDIALMDVRAPVEYASGSFPLATNLPLINDEERHEIGIRYKQEGQESAIELGENLVSGDKKQHLIEDWKSFIDANPNGVLYCFRGGMRSKITQQWIHEHTGIIYPRVEGGYKALRQYLINEMEISATTIKPRIIGGRTGVGKTIVLKTINPAIDLEGLAWHRGSAFGRHATPQPSQIDFENKLSIALLKHRENGNAPIAIEDEGRAIGSLNLPNCIHAMLQSSPVYIVEATVDERVNNSVQEYVHDTLAEYIELSGEEQGFQQWSDYLHDAVDRIKRRLGNDNYNNVKTLLDKALVEHLKHNNTQHHNDWIRSLLVDYYDPMYDYQLGKKTDRIVYSGTAEQVREVILK